MSSEPFDDDLKLVEACIKKDPAAWAFFVRKYSRLISISIEVRLAKYGVTLASCDMDDIRQAVLASIWHEEKLRSVKNRSGISHWLSIVSQNMALDHMRRSRRVRIPENVSLSERIGQAELVELIPSCGPDPSDCVRAKEVLKKVEETIESLSGKEKLMAKMNIVYGKKYREIAECLRIPEGTVSSCVKRAKEKLRKELKDL